MFQAEELETLGKRVDAIAGDMTNFGKTTNDNLAAINDRLTSHDQAIASIHDHDIATLTHRTDALENDLALVKVEVTGNTANITTNTNNITNITTNITTNTTNISSMNESITNIFQTLNKMNTKTAEQFDKIEDSLQQHRDSIHVTIKEMTEDNAKIRGIESQVAGLTDGHNGMRNDISKIEADLLNLNAVTQQCNTKVEEVTVLATNIDVHVKAQEKMIQQQADGDLKDIKAKIAELQELGTNYLSFRSEYVEPMHGQLSVIQQKLVQNADDAENTKTSYKTLIAGLQADIEGQIKLIKDGQIEHKEELHNAAEEFERLSQEIDSLKGNINNVSTTINEQLNIKFVSNRDELLNKIGEVEGKINNNHTAIANNAETFNDNMNKLKESLDKVSLNLNEQIVFNIESSNQGFESKIGDIYAKIQKNEEDIVNNNTSLNKEINILKESIENMSTNFGEQIEANITSHKESYNSMFGEIEDKLKKLHEEQLNCKDELSNAAEEFESINKELESLRENLQITTTSFTEKLNVNITSNNEAIDVRFGDLDEKINKASICINNVSETSKQDIIKLREDLDSITANAREQLEITINSNRESVSGEIENMNGRITNNETDISNLKDGAAEQSKKIQEALDNMSVSVDEKIEVNKNAINVTIKEIAEDNDKIRSIENELSGMAENLNNANASILKLKTDISNLDAVTQQFETKVEEVTVLATNIDVHVKAQEQMIQQQTEGDMNKINERITILEQKLNQNADEVDNSRNTYKILIEEMQAEIDGQIKLVKDEQVNHKEELHNAAEEFERLAKELEDIKANLTNVSASFNEQLEVNIVSNKENLDQTLGDINSRIKKNTDEIENISNKMKENIMEDVEVKVNQVRENIQINIESSNEKVLQHLSEEVDALKALVADLRVKEQDNLSEAIKMLEQQLETLKQNIEISVNVAQKDSQENLKSKLDEMDEKLQDVLNKNQENINLVVNMKEENNILMKSNSDDLKNEINDKLTDLTIMIENLKTLEKEDNEMVIKLVDDRNSKINTDLEKMMVDLHNKLDEQKDNFNVSIELSQQNMQGSLLTIIDQIKYDLDSLKQKEQEGKEVIIIDLQNKFDKFKDEINLVIDDSKQFSEGTNRDIAALQILIDDLKQKQKEDYDVILQISNDQDAKNRNDTNKLIENLVTKINSLKDNMDSSVADQMEEMKLTINDLRSQTTNDIKIFLDKNEEKAAENLTELKKLVSELEKEVEDLKKKMKEDMDVVFQLNQESEKKNNDAGEKLLIELENKIASLKDSIDININMSKDDTAEKIKAIQRSLDDLKKKEDEQIEVVVNDIDKKLDAIKQEININIDNSKSSDEDFTKQIADLYLQIHGLGEKDKANETLVIQLQQDTSNKLMGLSDLMEELRRKGADDLSIVIEQNAEKSNETIGNLMTLEEKLNNLSNELENLKKKEQEDMGVIIVDLQNKMDDLKNQINIDIDGTKKSSEELLNEKLKEMEKKLNDGQNKTSNELTKIEADLTNLNTITQKFETKVEEVTVLATNIDVHVKANEERIEKQTEEDIKEIKQKIAELQELGTNYLTFRSDYVEPMHGQLSVIQQTLVQSADDANNTKKTYQNMIDSVQADIELRIKQLKEEQLEHKDELHNAAEEFERLNNELEAIKANITNVSSTFNEQLQVNIVSNQENFDQKFGEINNKIKKNADDITNVQNVSMGEINKVKETIEKLMDNKIEITINKNKEELEDKIMKIDDKISKNQTDIDEKLTNNLEVMRSFHSESALQVERMTARVDEMNQDISKKNEDKIKALEDELDNLKNNYTVLVNMDNERKNEIKENSESIMGDVDVKLQEIRETIQINLDTVNENILANLAQEVDTLKALVADLRVKEQDDLTNAVKGLENQLEALKQNIEITVNVAQKDSQENLKSKLDEMDEKLQDVLNKNQENINLVVNMKEENNILMKSNSDDLKNEINDKLTDLTIMIENLKTLEKEDNEMVIKLVDDRNSKINTDLEKMMVDLHNKLDEQKDNFNVSIELSQQNMQGSLLTIIDQIKYDLDSLKQKEQEGKEVIIIDLQNKFDKFKDEINLVIDDSKQFSEGTNRDIAALQILIDDLKQKQKEDYDVILQISNDQDAKNRNDTNKLIENLVTKINSLKDNMDSSVADQMEEMKLTINDLRSQTTNDIKIFLDKNEEKAAENLTELKKLVSELEKEVEDLKKKMKEDMDVVFQLNQESEKKNNDAGEKLLIELENKIASLKDSIDININMSKDDTAEKIKAIQRSLDDLKKKEDEQIEVVVNDIDKKLDAIKQEININIDNSKSSDESFTKKINELTLQIQGLVEKDHSNETLIVNLEKDTSDKLKGLSNLLEEVRKQGADDIQVIIAANAEKNEDALSNLKFLQEKIDEIAKDLDDLKNKEKQDYDVVIQLNNDKFNQLKENENNLKKDIDSKIASIQENINVTIIKSENKIEEEMKENLEKIKNDLEELKKQEAKNINDSIANMDEKIAKIQENVEVTINVSQKAAEQNLSAKIEEIEKELRSMKENEQETLEGVITDLENKMKALKENIEVNINMTQNNYEEEIKNKLNHISIDLQDLKNKEVENENELKRATDEVKGNVDKEIKEINNKLEISINDLRNKTKAENEELDKSTKEDIERIDALCITLRALFDELKEKKKEDLELLLKINHDNAEEAKNTADNMMKEVESRILMMKDNIEININNTQKNIEDGLSKKVDDLSIVVEDLKKKEHEDMTIIINNIDEKMKHQQENNDENLLEKLEELRKQFEQKDKDNMDIVIQMDQANKDNTMQALEDKVNEIKKEIQLNINILNEKYDKNFNDSGIEVSMLADKLSDLEKSGDLLNSSLANISLEIEDKFKGDYAALRLRIEDLEKVKDQISELDDSITLLQPDVAGNKESIASLRLFESKQIKDFDELKKHSQEMLIVHRSEVDAKLKELFGLRDTQDQHGKEYKAFVESIMVQLEGLVIENTTQNDKMGKLDDFTKNMDEKFKELEQADSFLQETHMDLTKRTQFVETEIKRVEAASLALIKDQRTDAEELKVELKKVDSKTNPFFDRFEELQNQITLNKGGIVENSEKISYNTNGIQDITEILNNLKQKVEINIEDISLNKQHIQKNVGDFNVRLDDIHGDINSNFDEKLEKLNVLFNETMDAHAKGEDAKHQKISNTCTMLEMDLNSTNEKLSKLDGLHQQLKDQLAGQNSQYSEAMQQFRGQLDGLNVQHTETIQQMKEVTVLATNIDVHVKEQQAQQAIDTTNYDEKINEVKGFADDLSRDFIALSERLKTFDELSKNQGERILLIERLGDQLEQLSEETREDKQSIKSLWDEFHNQRERSNYFDGLMNKYDSERQQSEAKTKEEINITVQSNNKVIFLLCFFFIKLSHFNNQYVCHKAYNPKHLFFYLTYLFI